MEITKKLLKEIEEGLYEAYISTTVIDEVSRAKEPKRSSLDALLKDLNLPVLAVDEEIRHLAQRYIERGIIPVRYRNDAFHIAAAVVNNIDVIVSWNFTHIVKLRTKLGVNSVNLMEGYKEIEIYSPWEVVESEGA